MTDPNTKDAALDPKTYDSEQASRDTTTDSSTEQPADTGNSEPATTAEPSND
jgi:hypothetical protein